MAANVSPQPFSVGEKNSKLSEAIPNINNNVTYAACLNYKQSAASLTKTSLKPFEIVHGVPTFQFSMDEREEFAKEEGLHQAVMIKLSSGAPNLQILKSILPKILGIKGNCLLGLLAPRQFLIRCDQHEDYVACLARAVNYFQHNGREHQYRVFPWSVGYNPNEETSKAAVWISLPNLSPELFAHKPLLSIAVAVGKPIAIDKATQVRSRPSIARVKIIIDLLDKLPEKIRFQYLDVKTGKIVEDYQEIIYDNLPSYCYHCRHQVHEENQCRRLKGKAVQAAHVYDETVENEHQIVEKLQGDARDYLNAKRDGQQLIEGSKSNKITRQQVCDDLSKGADATGVRGAVQVEKTGGSRGPVVPVGDASTCANESSCFNTDRVAITSVKEAVNSVTNTAEVQIEAGQIIEKTTAAENTAQQSRIATVVAVQSVPASAFARGDGLNRANTGVPKVSNIEPGHPQQKVVDSASAIADRDRAGQLATLVSTAAIVRAETGQLVVKAIGDGSVMEQGNKVAADLDLLFLIRKIVQ